MTRETVATSQYLYQSPKAETAMGEWRMISKKILLVDDEEVVRFSCKRELSDNFDVTIVKVLIPLKGALK